MQPLRHCFSTSGLECKACSDIASLPPACKGPAAHALPRTSHMESRTPLLAHTQPADAGGDCCSNLKRLEYLEVCGGSVTDAGVAHIAAPLGRLTHLSLAQNARITDVSTPVLSQLCELVYLNLTRSRLSSTGVQRLHPLTVLPGPKHAC